MKKTIHKIHLWAGLVLCVPLVLLGLTGSFLVIEDYMGKTHYELATGKPHKISEIIEAAHNAAPQGLKPMMYRVGKTGEPDMVFVGMPGKGRPGSGPGGGKRMQMLIDPVSLQILNNDAGKNWMRLVKQFHSSLLLGEFGGRSIVGWLGVIMLGFGFTGLYLWWPKPGQVKRAFTVKLSSKGWRFNRDLHGMAGIWGFVAFIMVSFSGVYLTSPQSIDSGMAAIFHVRDMRANPTITRQQAIDDTELTLDEVIALAKKAAPDAILSSISLSTKSDQPYRVNLIPQNYRDGTPMIAVFIDPWARQVMDVRDPDDYDNAELFLSWQHAVHSGDAFGWAWRIIVFLIGFMPLLFSYTGISMYISKKRNKKNTKAKPKAKSKSKAKT